MPPEPTRARRSPHGPTAAEPRPDALPELLPLIENLLASTLTLLRQLRDGGLLTDPLRQQAMLVAVDGGSLELSLDAALPDSTAVDAHAERQAWRRRVLREAIADASSVDAAVAALLPSDPSASIAHGEVALSLVDMDPALASHAADLLDARTGASSLDAEAAA